MILALNIFLLWIAVIILCVGIAMIFLTKIPSKEVGFFIFSLIFGTILITIGLALGRIAFLNMNL